MDMSLSARIKAELTSYNGKMGIYIDDFKGNKIEINSEETFETASTIKTFILLDFFQQIHNKTKSLDDIIIYTEENLEDEIQCFATKLILKSTRILELPHLEIMASFSLCYMKEHS